MKNKGVFISIAILGTSIKEKAIFEKGREACREQTLKTKLLYRICYFKANIITRCLVFLLILQSVFVFSQTHLGHSKHSTILQDSLSSSLINIEKGDALFIESDKPTNGLYKVVHLQTEKVGYMKAEDVKFDKKFDTESTFKSIKSEEKDPTLKIHNNTGQPISLKIAGKEHLLVPHETSNIKLSKGKYYYQVSSPGFDHHYGHEAVEEYKLYEWEFYVEN